MGSKRESHTNQSRYQWLDKKVSNVTWLCIKLNGGDACDPHAFANGHFRHGHKSGCGLVPNDFEAMVHVLWTCAIYRGRLALNQNRFVINEPSWSCPVLVGFGFWPKRVATKALRLMPLSLTWP